MCRLELVETDNFPIFDGTSAVDLLLRRGSAGCDKCVAISHRNQGVTVSARIFNMLNIGPMPVYGHVRRKDDGFIGRRILRMELPGKRQRGRPKRMFMDEVKEGMSDVKVTEEGTEIGATGYGKSAVATPDGRSRKKKKNICLCRVPVVTERKLSS